MNQQPNLLKNVEMQGGLHPMYAPPAAPVLCPDGWFAGFYKRHYKKSGVPYKQGYKLVSFAGEAIKMLTVPNSNQTAISLGPFKDFPLALKSGESFLQSNGKKSNYGSELKALPACPGLYHFDGDRRTGGQFMGGLLIRSVDTELVWVFAQVGAASNSLLLAESFRIGGPIRDVVRHCMAALPGVPLPPGL